jgi:hypothetical protein
MNESVFLHRLKGILKMPIQESSKSPEIPEWVQCLLRSQPGQKVRVMTKEERQKREAEEEQWLRNTKT